MPGPPLNAVAYAGNREVEVAWTGGADNGTPITGYTVTSTPGTFTCTTTGALTCYVTGLTNGTNYSFAVKATNGRGAGPTATLVKGVTPSTYASAPLDVKAVAHNGYATVSWTAPSTDGGSSITGYTVTSKPTDKTCSTTADTLTCRVTNLANGSPYTFRVRATNATGAGPASAASNVATPSELPTAPLTVKATASAGAATVTWKRGHTQRHTHRQVHRDQHTGKKSCTWTTGSLSCQVTGLTDGTAYVFRVTAGNGKGTGPPSTPSNAVIPISAPIAGPIITGRVLDKPVGHRHVEHPDTGHRRRGQPSPAMWSRPNRRNNEEDHNTTATTATVGPIWCNGTIYTVTVAAVSPRGTGPATTASSTLVPSTVPVAPTTVTATPGNEEAKVLWHASARRWVTGDLVHGHQPHRAHLCTWTLTRSSPTSLTCT